MRLSLDVSRRERISDLSSPSRRKDGTRALGGECHSREIELPAVKVNVAGWKYLKYECFVGFLSGLRAWLVGRSRPIFFHPTPETVVAVVSLELRHQLINWRPFRHDRRRVPHVRGVNYFCLRKFNCR